ncbi:MAG: hypothetical protein WDZ45_01575 [Flavobacteriaceae bacterium]
MHKSTILYLFTALLITTPLFAQQYTENENQNNTSSTQNLENYTSRATRYVDENTNGSPFLKESFEIGSILNESGVLVSNVLLRYNAFHDEFQVKQNINDGDDKIQAVRKSTDFFIKTGDEIYTYLLPSDGIGGYYNILVEGDKVNLFKKSSKKFIEGVQSVNMMTGNHPNRLIDESSYYVVNSKGEVTELPNSKNKRLQAIAGDKRNELKKYAKSKDLNPKKEEDLIKLVEYFNQNF